MKKDKIQLAADGKQPQYRAWRIQQAKISHLQATLEAAEEVIKIFERPYEYNELQVRTILEKYHQLKTKSQS